MSLIPPWHINFSFQFDILMRDIFSLHTRLSEIIEDFPPCCQIYLQSYYKSISIGLIHYNNYDMNQNGATLTQGFIRDLFLGLSRQIKEPCAQILGFQISQINKNQIILRISDGETFLDCPLVGLYRIQDHKIVSSQQNSITNTFKKHDIIRVMDYFSKIQESKICPLKIIIRKMVQIGHINQKIGIPQEIAQFVENNHLGTEKKQKNQNLNFKNPQTLRNGTDQTKPIKLQDLQEENHYTMSYQSIASLPPPSMPQNMNGSISIVPQNQLKNLNYPPLQHVPNFKYEPNKQRDTQTPLSLRQILQQCDGFFIGRLLRVKTAMKETKDGPMTVLFLGFVDRNNQMVRINVAGRIALKQEKNLKKGKCYYIKGLQLIKSKLVSPQIRLKDKEYKIHEIANEEITSQYSKQYFHWDHDADFIEYENVDVIGIVDQIQEKTSYKQNATNDQRDVVRIVIRNKLKTVKVSFWADQIKNLQGFDLKLKEPIILEDIKKKKSFFLDYTFESSMFKINDDPDLKAKFEDLLPSPEERPEPKNIKQLRQLYEQEPSNTKVRTLRVYIIKIHENRVIYKLCQDCKKKVDRNVEICRECGTSNFAFKFNCQIQFADHTDSVSAIVFDLTAHRLFDKTAAQINEMSQQQVQKLVESFDFKEYVIGFENKREKIVVRMAEPLQLTEVVKNTSENISQIQYLLKHQRTILKEEIITE